MIGNIDQPRIVRGDADAQLRELTNYLFQLVETLNFNFNDIQNTFSEIKGEIKKVREDTDGTV